MLARHMVRMSTAMHGTTWSAGMRAEPLEKMVTGTTKQVCWAGLSGLNFTIIVRLPQLHVLTCTILRTTMVGLSVCTRRALM